MGLWELHSEDILRCSHCAPDASLAQLVEHALRKRMVVGSIPTGGFLLGCFLRKCQHAKCRTVDHGRMFSRTYAQVPKISQAAIAQLGERQTEDLKVPSSIPGLGILF